ncbi:MAG TPA: LysM peptidoglycan-binding domain-containing protein [Leucothrix mucor]|nr:LysM peptidoglycan-binding domain-containing protein [Leucothrix mucor]
MKILRPIFLLSSLLVLSSQLVVAADKDKAMLDALSAEAKETSMDEGVASKELAAEPSIIPKSEAGFSALEQKISAQIKGLLADTSTKGESDTAQDSQLESKLENIVSSALLKGNKLNDIRSAVSAAMLTIKKEGVGEEAVSEKTIESASKALENIVGENKAIAAGDSKDAYVQSLQAELSADTDGSKPKTPDATKAPSKEVAVATEKKELKPATLRNVVPSVAKSKPSVTEVGASVTTITVLEGETLFKIAQRVYGSGTNYLALYEANKDTIEDPNVIRIGQVLKVPR